MAIYHLNAKVHSRGTDPKLHALRSYAYRSGTRVKDPVTGRIYNYQSKQAEVVLTETLTPRHIIVPDWMRDGPQLWDKVNALETRVRKDAQIFKELEMALPVELGLPEWATLVRGFVNEQLTDAGMVSSYSIHQKAGNPHVHIMATLRGIEIAGNDAEVNYDNDSGQGDFDNATAPIRFGKKNRDWNSKAMLAQWRKAWADHVNAALLKAGSDQRVTHQSFAELGIEREATTHIGPDFKKDNDYQTKRAARIQRNQQVNQRNKQRGEQRRHAAYKALAAGVRGAQLSVGLQGPSHPTPEQAPTAARVKALSNALTTANSWEVQAQWSIRHALTEFQLSDYPARCKAMTSMGKQYSWQDFGQDIQRFAHSDAGWQRAWWDEQMATLKGEALSIFSTAVPTWFEGCKPPSPAQPESQTDSAAKAYPLGPYDPNPEQTLLAAINQHQELQSIPVAPVPANPTIWGGVHDGLVMAPQAIRTREAGNPWGITPEDAGGRFQPQEWPTPPNGW